jgi:glutamate-5-semialdehyde dehydrogenase
MSTTLQTAQSAKVASRVLAPLTESRRNAALTAMADAVSAESETLLAANARDLEVAATLTGEEALSPATLSRLKLTEGKLREMVEQIRSVAALPDPLNKTLDAIELDHGLDMQKVSVSLGVLCVIFEARPDAVTQIAALALKSGNAVILKPGREVEHTATALVTLLRETLTAQGLPPESISLVLGRGPIAELLQMHTLVDMVIPRGSKALVEYVQANTRIPVLGHAEGICHIYVDKTFTPEIALRVIDDSKTDYPAACNAVETVLVHRDIAAEFLPRLSTHLRSRGVRIHTTNEAGSYFRGDEERVTDWHHEYGELALSIGIVDSIEAAIDHIHAHGSLHTETILTEDPAAAAQFLREVDAAGVFHNASTRFADGFRYGFGAEVGVSTSKFHARGPVGLEGLTTYKYLIRGHGQIAADYRGPAARPFTHKRPA